MYAYFGATGPPTGCWSSTTTVGPVPCPGTHRRLVRAWRAAQHPDGRAVFTVEEWRTSPRPRPGSQSRRDLVVVIPAGSRSASRLRDRRSEVPARVANHADPGNLRASMAMAMSDYIAFGTSLRLPGRLAARTGHQPVGASQPLSEFDLYVPALLVLAIIMCCSRRGSLVKEVDKGTMSRLMLSRLGTAELMAAVSANQVLVGVATLDSRSARPGPSVTAPAVPSGPCWSSARSRRSGGGAERHRGGVPRLDLRTAHRSDLSVLRLMFFSESMMPLPKVTLFHLAVTPST